MSILKIFGVIIGSLILFFVTLYIYTSFAPSLPIYVQSVNTNVSSTYDAVGVGRARVTVDQAKVSAGVSVTGVSAQSVQELTKSKTVKGHCIR